MARVGCLPAQPSKESLQKVCGGFLACVEEQFTSMVPAKFAQQHLQEIEKTFLEVFLNLGDLISEPKNIIYIYIHTYIYI